MQIQISWLLKKPTDLDLHCLQRQGISGFSRTRVKTHSVLTTEVWNSSFEHKILQSSYTDNIANGDYGEGNLDSYFSMYTIVFVELSEGLKI